METKHLQVVDRAADDFDMVSEAVRPPVWYNAAFLKDQHFKLRTLANGHPQILQGYFFGGFQLLDLIITELKSHLTCYNSMPLIG